MGPLKEKVMIHLKTVTKRINESMQPSKWEMLCFGNIAKGT